MKIERGSRVFLDTNILLEATDQGRRWHDRAVQVFQEWPGSGISLYASGQVLREYLVAATRPVEKNGLGLAGVDALINFREFSRCLSLCDENAKVNGKLIAWAEHYGTVGRKLHDLNILATMWGSGLECLLTLNQADFPKDTGIVILDLAEKGVLGFKI